MKRLDTGITVAIFIALLAIYVHTLAPSLLYGDSAEFQTIAYTLGIGHPTGYPVYILLAKVFTLIPIGDIAYRVNLLSAVAAALTVSLVFLILRVLGASQVSAALSIFFLAFAEIFWKYASIAEIYTFSSVCLVFILYSLLAWKETGNPRWLFAAGLVGGLSLGIHTTVALSAIAILIYLFVSPLPMEEGLGVRVKPALLGALLGVVIFLFSFLFLDYINASAGYYNTVVYHALSVWGMIPADFDSPLERFAFLYFPPQFSGQFFAVSSNIIWERINEFFSVVSWNVIIALLGVISLFIARKNSTVRWREAVLLVVAFVAFLFFAVSYDVYDYYVYFIPAILLLVIATGLGFSALSEMISFVPDIPKVLPGIVVGVLILADLWLLFPHILVSWESRIPPFTDDYEALLFSSINPRQYEAEQTLEYLGDSAIVFTDWDRVYNFYYVGHVLQGRNEMDFHETYPQEGVTSLADSTLEYIEANVASRPIYFTERPSELANHYKITRAGLGLYRIEGK